LAKTGALKDSARKRIIKKVIVLFIFRLLWCLIFVLKL
jgi:hypothetical protein